MTNSLVNTIVRRSFLFQSERMRYQCDLKTVHGDPGIGVRDLGQRVKHWSRARSPRLPSPSSSSTFLATGSSSLWLATAAACATAAAWASTAALAASSSRLLRLSWFLSLMMRAWCTLISRFRRSPSCAPTRSAVLPAGYCARDPSRIGMMTGCWLSCSICSTCSTVSN